MGILEIAVQFFEGLKWPFTRLEDETALQVPFRGENGEWPCYAFTHEKEEQFAFYSICPARAPEERLMTVAEFITRLNCGLVIGNFELDFEDGEIRFKTSIDVEGDRLSTTLVEQLVLANVTFMDLCLPAMMKVIYGDMSPAQAVAQIEDVAGGNVED